MTKYFGKRWIVKLLVLFLRVLHFEQVGISSPSKTSSLINKSKQLSNLQRLDVGSGTLNEDGEKTREKCPWKYVHTNNNNKWFLELYLKSQNGSNVTLVLPQTVHFSELFSWPTNKSLITDFSTFEYHSHVRSALMLSDRLSSISSFSPLVPLFRAQCSASKKNRRNSWASCCEQPLYIRCFDENANFNSLGVTELVDPDHISLINLENSVTIFESFTAVDERMSLFVLR